MHRKRKELSVTSAAQRERFSPLERAELVETVLASSSFPYRAKIDQLWATEAEDRIDAFETGELRSKAASDVLARIERGDRG